VSRFQSYSSALSWLFARNQFAMKLGLENPRRLLAALGNPEQGGTFLHVAGTNGKGSVCAALAAMLPALGLRRVGLYTSPHLVSFRERIRVDGAPVPVRYVTDWLNRNMPVLEEFNPTYFEIVTAMALCWFRESGCEAAVLETGLGGRLDATNVVAPRATAITSIALDHTAILGDTLEAILREKLGIVKPKGPHVRRARHC
jgi:dihydrofolate synthase / folylpolyglutamate synthase